MAYYSFSLCHSYLLTLQIHFCILLHYQSLYIQVAPGLIDMNVKKKEAAAGAGRDTCAAISKKEDEHDPVLRQLVDALFPNYFVVTHSRKGIGTILLPSGWDGEFQVGQDLQSIVMLNKAPDTIHDAQTLLGQNGVNGSNVHVDALATSIKERNEKDIKEQGLNTINDISNDFILWHLPLKIREELFDI
jgi:hypothetical protein